MSGRNGYSFPVIHGEPPTVRYSIAAAAMEKLKSLSVKQNSGDGEVVEAVYDGGTGAAAITLSDYNGLPIGSVIFDVQAFKTHYKTAATTWKSSAAAS